LTQKTFQYSIPRSQCRPRANAVNQVCEVPGRRITRLGDQSLAKMTEARDDCAAGIIYRHMPDIGFSSLIDTVIRDWCNSSACVPCASGGQRRIYFSSPPFDGRSFWFSSNADRSMRNSSLIASSRGKSQAFFELAKRFERLCEGF
jgi:hypothetical protein